MRELSKNRKLLEAKLKAQDAKVLELEEQLKEKNQEISKLTAIGTENNTKTINLHDENFKYLSSNKTSKAHTVHKNTAIGFRKKTVSYIGLNKESELKEWFIECVKSIKRDVAYRKNSGQQFDLETIHSI